MSAFHGVRDPLDYSAQWILPKARRLYSYKGAVRFRLEKENEENRGGQSVGRVESSGVRRYKDPSENTEAFAANIFETGTG